MSLSIFLWVLFAAALHAGWNAIVKHGSDKLLTTILITASAALLSALALPLLPSPARASWPWLAASALIQVSYYGLLARTYRSTDMSASYPLMRGCAPILVAIISTVFFSEVLGVGAWLGIALISAGILCMAVGNSLRQLSLPLTIATVIALYTLVDAHGARLSGNPLSYTLWLFLLSGIPLPLWALSCRRAELGRYLQGNWHYGVIGGVGTTISYGMALWAMTQAPVAMISALRETSILFGILISALILRERVSRQRWLAAAVIVTGAVALRMA